MQQFFDLLDADHQIPVKNRNFAAGKHLHSYETKVDRLMKKGAGVIFTGGVGKIGHIMFWESTFGVRLNRSLAEQVLWVRGAPLTFGTIDQNETTSSATDDYPLKVCVVSGEELGGMGEPYVHQHEGTTVKFCCKPCLKKFNEDPESYLAKLEQ